MAATTAELVLLASDQATPTIKRVAATTQRQFQTMRVGAGQVSSSFSSAAGSVTRYVAAFAGMAAATALVRSAIASAIEAEKVEALLAQQVEATGVSWQDHGAAIQEQIAAAARYGAVTRTEVQKVLSSLVTTTGDVSQALSVLSLAMDFAASTGMKVEQAGRMIARALEGDIVALQTYLPQIKELNQSLGKTATPAEKAAAPVINIPIEGSAIMDKDTLDQVMNQAVDVIGEILQGRNGVAGNLQIHTTRL